MRHMRKNVVDRTRREFAALDRLVARLRPGDWKRRVPRPPTRDPWTVKDALAHILYWKEHTARVIRGERRPPEMRGLDVEQINRLVYRRWRRRRPSEVAAWHRRVHAEAPELPRHVVQAGLGRARRFARRQLEQRQLVVLLTEAEEHHPLFQVLVGDLQSQSPRVEIPRGAGITDFQHEVAELGCLNHASLLAAPEDTGKRISLLVVVEGAGEDHSH